MFHKVQIGLLIGSLIIGCGLFTGCKKDCATGTTECINGELIRTCVPTDSDPEWLISQCPDNSACVDDGGDAGSGASVAACIGTCTTGESECVDDSLARLCVNGGVWQLDMCDVGEKCSASTGKCTVGQGDGSVQACVPGTKQCASDRVEKICDPDGTAWVEQACPANEVCLGTECEPDPAGTCDNGNQCLDNTHVIRCLGTDQGYVMETCPANTYCLGGACRGSVCAIGSTCAGPNQVRDCTDGENFKDTQCDVNEVCEQRVDTNTASCVPKECNLNTTVCGDPRDPSVDTTTTFTTCVTSAVTGNPAWVNGECIGLTSCDPTVLTGSSTVQSPCRQDCTPGAQRCVGAGGATSGTGVLSGIQTCGKDGTWEPTVNCNQGTSTYLQCALTPNQDPSKLPTAVCAEPVCAAVFNYNNANMDPLTNLDGACTDTGKMRLCQADGSLASATDCANDVCNVGPLAVQADGYTPGLCPKTPVCDDGEERCVWDGTTPTPYYQTCSNGFWGDALETCANDGLCYPAGTDGKGKICGAECVPGSHMCDASDPDGKSIQACNNKGKLGPSETCDKGLCTYNGTFSDAACMLDCVPRETVCVGSTVLAADNAHYGTSMEAVCGTDGLLKAATSCDPGSTCRKTATGVVLGCVECIGTDAPGGNSSGVNDTVCNTNDATHIMECAADNTFSDRACNGSKTCQGGGMLACGSCYSSYGYLLASCSEALVDDAQYCNYCNVPQNGGGSSYVECTEANIAATGDPVSATCAGNGFGNPTDITGSYYGSVAGCCGSYVAGVSSCTSRGLGTSTSVGGVADCCSSSVYATGSGIAYCAAP